MEAQAKEFFKKYNEIFDSGNMELFSKMFHEPFMSVRPDGTIASMPTNIIAEGFFKGAFEAWRKEGYQYFSTKDFHVIAIGAKSMLVTLTWELLDADRKLIREWRQSYNLLKADEQWKVLTSTFHI